MLEIAILDNVERLGDNQPSLDKSQLLVEYLNLIPTATTSPSMSSGGFFIDVGDGNSLCATSSGSTPVYKINHDTGALSTEFGGVALGLSTTMVYERGYVWGASSNASYYGLWVRTPAGSWSKALSATTSTAISYDPVGKKYYWTDSLSNKYILQNGAASSVASIPAGVVSPQDAYNNSNAGVADPLLKVQSITDNAYKTQGGVDTIVKLPAILHSQIKSGTPKIVKIKGTDYVLNLTTVAGQSAAGSSLIEGGNSAWVISISNVVTGATQVLGTTPKLTKFGGTWATWVLAADTDFATLEARLENGVLSFLIYGTVYVTGGNNGVMRVSVPVRVKI